jgi:hypothetical protein
MVLNKLIKKIRYINTYFKIKHIIKDGKSYILYFDKRGIGKTTSLMKLGIKYNIPIIEPSPRIKELTYNYPNVNIIPPSKWVVMGTNYPLIIIDEGIGDSYIDWLLSVGQNIIIITSN